MDQLLSCFQKSIRRCDNKALECIVKLDKQNYYIWNKLAVISSEDIGIASPTITTYLLNQNKLFIREKSVEKKKYILCNTVNTLL
jgi:replication-associated recombination protein RarA